MTQNLNLQALMQTLAAKMNVYIGHGLQLATCPFHPQDITTERDEDHGPRN